MKRTLALILAFAAPAAWADDAIGNVGSVRGDYWTRFNQLEINLVLNAIPFVDVEMGLQLPSSVAHIAAGPRFEVIQRESEAGITLRIVALFGGWVSLGNPVTFTSVSASPGIEATYWFARRFGVTGSISVPVLVPYSSGGLNGAATQASPRLGIGLSF